MLGGLGSLLASGLRLHGRFFDFLSLGSDELEVTADRLTVSQGNRFAVERGFRLASILRIVLPVTPCSELVTFRRMSRLDLGRTLVCLSLHLVAFTLRVQLCLVAVDIPAGRPAPGARGSG